MISREGLQWWDISKVDSGPMIRLSLEQQAGESPIHEHKDGLIRSLQIQSIEQKVCFMCEFALRR